MAKKKSLFGIKSLIVVAICCFIIGIVITAAFEVTETSEAQNFWKEHNGAPKAPSTLPVGLPSFAQLAKAHTPSVVNISTVHVVKGGGQMMVPGLKGPFEDFFGDEFFEKFFGGQQQQRDFKRKSLGSGFVINKEGYILTNNHVIENATEIVVTFSEEKKEYKAEVIGSDKKLDIGLIKIEADHDLPVAALGDSDALSIGDWVMAIGNPFGLGGTVTAGIISQKGRVLGAGPYDDFLQTDASINPGNSGGPLFDLSGEVVGINTAIIARGQGIGFAIPINIVKEVLLQLREAGSVSRGWIGVSIQSLTPELAEHFGIENDSGALISAVTPGDPAERAGIRGGDIIIEFNGKPIEELTQLPRTVANTPKGTKVKVKLLRDGKEISLFVTVGEREEDSVASVTPGSGTQSEELLGITVQAITPGLAETLGLAKKDKGVVISDVDSSGPAAMAGLRRGDIIREINKHRIEDLEAYRKATDDLKAGKKILMLIEREEGTFYLSIKIGE
ncbi:MAG: DegQ family serine endoprotease [Proteobacteria bacterium]|nr:DegQ family serine endoprotease [Pseudomonadota bacterium]